MNNYAEKSGKISGYLAESFDKFTVEGDEEHDVDPFLPEMLLSKGVGEKIIDVDLPRIPLPELKVPCSRDNTSVLDDTEPKFQNQDRQRNHLLLLILIQHGLN